MRVIDLGHIVIGDEEVRPVLPVHVQELHPWHRSTQDDIQIHTYMHLHAYTHTYAYSYTHTYTHTYIYKHTCTHAHIHTP